MRNFVIAILTAVNSCGVCVAEDEILDDISVNLAECEGVFAYGVNRYVMESNEGAAKVMALQMARTSTALMANNYEDGVVADYKIRAFKDERRKVKPILDNHPELLASEINACMNYVNEIFRTTNVTKVRMWNTEFFDVVEQMAKKIRADVGIE